MVRFSLFSGGYDFDGLLAQRHRDFLRLALVDCSRIVLANALDTLGIAAPESM